MCIKIIFLLLIFKITSQFPSETACENSRKCECIPFESGKIEYHCPFSEQNARKFSIVISPGRKRMKINCENVENLTRDDFPSGNFEGITRLTVQECPIPALGFRELTENFEFSSNLQVLNFDARTVRNFTNSNLFSGLENLKKLVLNYDNLTEISGIIFTGITKLEELMLGNNQVVLNSEIFRETSGLKFLSLHSNNLMEIPKGTFQGLSKLERLDLFDNNLEKLENEVFNDLSRLKFLELSVNKLGKIENSTFETLENLEVLSLKRNNLSEFSKASIWKNTKLRKIRLDENFHIKLHNDVFSNFPNLEYVKLSNNNLEKLAENLFENSTEIKEIYIDNNAFEKIPLKIFKNLKKLQELHLEFNKILELSPELFEDLSSLENLQIHHNNLEKLHEKTLENLENLKEINLSFNKIKKIHPFTFSRTKNLARLYLRNNLLDFDESHEKTTPFSNYFYTNLEEVDLSFNQIKNYPYKLNTIARMREIKLDHNLITRVEMAQLISFNPYELSVNLGYNNISSFDFEDFSTPDGEFNPLTLNITNNPIKCDCRAVKFVQFLQDKNRRAVKIEYNELKCGDDQSWLLDKVKLKDLKCFYGGNCTKIGVCDCSFRSFDETVELNCSNRGLKEFPSLDFPEELKGKNVELDLHQNSLENSILGVDGYDNVTKLNLSGNSIGNLTWLPGNLKEIDLRNNSLEVADELLLETLRKLSGMENAFLGNNSWKCDCSMKNFSKFLKDHLQQTDVMEIRCSSSGKRVVEMSEKDFCPSKTDKIFRTLFPILILLLIFLMFFMFFQVYKQEILVYLYARGICLWLVKEDELDKDKIYDAFISFSQKDEQFVTEKIISTLENEENFKCCVHVRDWIPGEMIPTQIMRSVRDSKRTIVVLSANFLESVWGILEFKTAHTESMKEGLARVIIIIYGDVKIDSLDEELKSYMRTNTYIKWGDPWFYDKLKYALPKVKKGGKMSKHDNIMRFIDEKFEKIQEKSCGITLDPRRLEGNA